MTAATWTSQPFPPDGAAASEGIKRQLGAPKLDPLDIVVREVAQNSWDARLKPDGSIDLAIQLSHLSGDLLAEWRKALLAGQHLEHFGLNALLQGDEIVVANFSDRGTTGLGGPIRSDVVGKGTPDFVNFIRNIGEPRDTELGGGTYGFGKGATFRVSRSDAVLVDTQCVVAGATQRRLIGSALGTAFSQGGRRYTGRHFWGIPDGSVTDPLLDKPAAALGERLGLRGFAEGQTGTDIVIIGLDLGTGKNDEPRTLEAAGRYVASSVLWNLWPKLIDDGEGPRMSVSLAIEGEILEIPDPRKEPRLRPFVKALRDLETDKATSATRKSAPKVIGSYAAVVEPVHRASDPLVDAAAPFPHPAHHCARMRAVELVVDYVDGPELAQDGIHYGAVFRAHPDADHHFAEAEPPTHDDWVLRHLTGTSRGVVTKAKSFVKEQLEGLRPGASAALGASGSVPLGGLASRLAAGLPLAPGDAAGSAQPGSGGGAGGSGSGGGGTKRIFRVTREPALRVTSTGTEVVTHCAAEPSDMRIVLTMAATAAVDGGSEKSPPSGAAIPVPLHWEAVGSSEVRVGEHLHLDPEDSREWVSVVATATDAATLVTIAAKVVDDA